MNVRSPWGAAPSYCCSIVYPLYCSRYQFIDSTPPVHRLPTRPVAEVEVRRFVWTTGPVSLPFDAAARIQTPALIVFSRQRKQPFVCWYSDDRGALHQRAFRPAMTSVAWLWWCEQSMRFVVQLVCPAHSYVQTLSSGNEDSHSRADTKKATELARRPTAEVFNVADTKVLDDEHCHRRQLYRSIFSCCSSPVRSVENNVLREP
ncbi:hypothetical protein Q1695_001609 [Nippostrongylus brasiliensis]|nr:hypothetical protein Q1695_001609 [Nippostrongylus brasiliensis]